MKNFYFDNEDDFIEWNEGKGNLVTAVYTRHGILCDVFEKDLLNLIDLGILDESCTINKNLTEEQEKWFTDVFGVQIHIGIEALISLFLEKRDGNFFANGVKMPPIKFWGNDCEVESIYIENGKAYMHLCTHEFEGDIPVESISSENQKIIIDTMMPFI